MAGQAQTVAVTVRVGFLGAGFIATYHSKALRHSGEDVTWSGVYDLDQARAEAFGAITKARVCASEEELLDRCDAVFVCTWTAAHPESVAAAASRGLAVFCEKPLAVDLAGARQMGEAVERAGVVNQVGLVLRYSPAFCWMRHLISDPSSGRVMAVVFRDDQYIPIQGMYGSSWRSERAKAGSGTLLEHSIHDVDMIEFLCGPVGSVTAFSDSAHGLDGIEDTVAAAFRIPPVGVGSLVSVWHDVLARPSLRRVEVLCERMWCVLDGDDWFGPVRWTRGSEPEDSLGGHELAQRVHELGLAAPNPDAAFVEAVREGRPARPDFATAVRAHAVVDAAYRSAASGGVPVLIDDGGDR